jgi:hypothetical protein
MISDKIYKLSIFFKTEMEKRSDIASDLATRIMHSLVPTGRHPDEDKQKMTFLVATHLIGVAERYLDSAIKIILDELKYSNNQKIAAIGNSKYPKEQYLNILNLSIKSFMDPTQWEIRFGGKKWAAFSERVIDLYHAINKFKKAKQENNSKVMNEQSGLISAYLNILDGMSHNSDSFLNRIINQELAEETEGNYNDDVYELANKKEQEIIDLMDIKELRNKHDVINHIKNKIYNNPESYLYREHLRDIYNPKERSSPENVKQEMEIIRQKKQTINFVNSFIDRLIEELELGIKNGSDVEDYIAKFNKIISYYKFKGIKKDLEAIISKYNLESMYGLINALEEIKQFILDNIELTLTNFVYS